MSELFHDSLDSTIEEFRVSKYGHHVTLSHDNIESRFTRFDNKTELISRVCHELEDQIKETLADISINEIINLGINSVGLIIETSTDKETDAITFDPEIWETSDHYDTEDDKISCGKEKAGF